MSYQHTQLETRQSIFVDAYDAAHLVQSLLDRVLLPATAGLYLPDQMEPVMKVGGTYWYEKIVFVEKVVTQEVRPVINREMVEIAPGYVVGPVINMLTTTTPWQYYRYEYIPVTNFQEVSQTPWDIVATNPDFDPRPKQVVLPHHLAKDVLHQPTLPVIGLKIVQEMLANEVESSRAYNRSAPGSIESIVLPFLQPMYQNREHIRSDPWFVETLNMVFDAVLPLAHSLRAHLSQDPFQMYAVRYHQQFQFQIDMLGDYRISEWERLQSDPEFQQWQRTRGSAMWGENTLPSAYTATSNPYR